VIFSFRQTFKVSCVGCSLSSLFPISFTGRRFSISSPPDFFDEPYTDWPKPIPRAPRPPSCRAKILLADARIGHFFWHPERFFFLTRFLVFVGDRERRPPFFERGMSSSAGVNSSLSAECLSLVDVDPIFAPFSQDIVPSTRFPEKEMIPVCQGEFFLFRDRRDIHERSGSLFILPLLPSSLEA